MIETELIHYGYLFIFFGTIVEGDATLLTAAFLAHRGHFRLSWVLLVAALSTLVASQCYFLIARHAGAKWLQAMGGRSARMEKVIRWSVERGALMVLASRFMIGFRTLIPAACGMTGMSVGRFFVWNAIGAALWTASFGLAGYLGGHAVSILLEDARRHEWTLAALGAFATAGLILWRTHGRELTDIWYLRKALARSR